MLTRDEFEKFAENIKFQAKCWHIDDTPEAIMTLAENLLDLIERITFTDKEATDD